MMPWEQEQGPDPHTLRWETEECHEYGAPSVQLVARYTDRHGNAQKYVLAVGMSEETAQYVIRLHDEAR